MQEIQIDQEIPLLTQVSRDLTRANAASTLGGLASTSPFVNTLTEVYRSWASLRRDGLSAQKQCLQDHVVNICRLFEGDDVADEIGDDDWDENELDEDENDFDEGLYFYEIEDVDLEDEDEDDDETFGSDGNMFELEETDESEQEDSDLLYR
ncbi:hypothetical protein FisN_14Lh292 [Fistulifera solaris]|uniref:Uncharacterized protein n=1 Tax=Fistulifera solaris TaxID=1519565 RepID=A0A1Z5J9V9_FISSO|nr:hypothetical protein FisN_14Lh292 [Fistulifera solaris]|eukprot:GAX10770.1 hypothetical protein FisN_14Lh292 [Fistulifera solaris]